MTAGKMIEKDGNAMVTCNGKSVYNGIAIGKIFVYKKNEQQVNRIRIHDVAFEMQRFHEAKVLAVLQLQELHERASREVGEVNAAIFEIHQMMLEDQDYLDSIENIIKNQELNAEYAVATTGDNYSLMFSSMDDAYMRERAADVKDVSERILSILKGNQSITITYDEPVIIVAEDLAPSETIQFDKEKVLAFVTVKGSLNSHTAILARSMNIPALIETEINTDSTMNGKLAIVDGFMGKIFIEPNEDVLRELQKKYELEEQKKLLLQEMKGKENCTLDGVKIDLFANIGNSKDIAYVFKNDGGGIGLFRSEFVYLGKNDFPSEEEQFQIYKTVAETMAGKKVVIRTLDIGADKQAEYFQLDKEENPALGIRAIRICLTKPEIFITQLRALFRASYYGNIAIMYPMITSLREIKRIKEIVVKVKEELREQGFPFKDVEEGIMIETPAAAMISDLLAPEVDFFSIGTNDLTQYTLAVDRQNAKLDEFVDTHHKAILRLIKMTVENAHNNSIWVGICGELGADPALTQLFLALGVDELSVSPSKILQLRKLIRETNISEIREDLFRKLL